MRGIFGINMVPKEIVVRNNFHSFFFFFKFTQSKTITPSIQKGLVRVKENEKTLEEKKKKKTTENKRNLYSCSKDCEKCEADYRQT